MARRKNESRSAQYANLLRELGWTILDLKETIDDEPWSEVAARKNEHEVRVVDAFIADQSGWWWSVEIDGRALRDDYDGQRILLRSAMSDLRDLDENYA
jgi:hypothetical protein